jgi:hypothetical protein
MQNVPGGSAMFQMDFRKKNKKFYPQNMFLVGAQAGCGDATSLCKNLVKNAIT